MGVADINELPPRQREAIMQSLEERFWAKVKQAGSDECWLWTAGTTRDGYGRMSDGVRRGSVILAHRASYKIANGDIPAEACVCHKCDTPRCCNPSHLFLGTRAENNTDRVEKCRSARLRGEANGRAKLSQLSVRVIRRMPAFGFLRKEAAEVFGVGATVVKDILAGRLWKHV